MPRILDLHARGSSSMDSFKPIYFHRASELKAATLIEPALMTCSPLAVFDARLYIHVRDLNELA